MKAEKIILGLAGIAVICKFMHWYGGGPFLTVSLSTLAMVYMVGGFYFLQAKGEEKRTILAVITGVLFSISCIGILFRLMYWPGAKAMLFIPVIALPVLVAVVFYLKSKETSQPLATDKKLLIRLLGFAVIVTALYALSNKQLLTLQYPNDPEVVRIKSNHFDHPENEDYTREDKEYVEEQRKK